MLNPGQMWLLPTPVDMRSGIDTLVQIVMQVKNNTPVSDCAFIFRNKNGLRLKLLYWDQHGVWLCQRRLHTGRFVWPKADEPVWTLTPAQFDWLVMGVDWQRLSASQAQWHVF